MSQWNFRLLLVGTEKELKISGIKNALTNIFISCLVFRSILEPWHLQQQVFFLRSPG